MSKIDFLKTSLQNMKTVGAIARSSRFLCKKMISFTDFSTAKIIVEIGAGDGVITKHILESMQEDATLIAFEVLPDMVEKLKEINDPRLKVVADSAELIEKYLISFGFEKADSIVSAIPFVMMPDELALAIIQACADNLKTGGKFSQVHYSLIAKKLYEQVFGNVDVNFVPLNVPPAWVLVSEKQ